ncbi:NhaP-type Na+/H+ or K+/H+ antiporter [Motilibacter peucedani]|uniref:NhaP-type Na+/H+ or K+/H+ antiporter n=1 Tax=Motilibacter peucedani TaxID=598650 RepID=A0A420XQ36_9ACTN|nr:cation:proton antiporter [Motilibacter peucedani]RKS75398.1 NhaP-type Na+/H+ or K+/H+ antiporter [Motilibacter peucedani]
MLTALLFALAGASALAAAALPRAAEGRPFSLPLVFLAAGVVLGLVPSVPEVDPVQHNDAVLNLTEVVVLVALMGAGLALDRPLGWKTWKTTWRLLVVAMPVTIAIVTLTGWALAGLPFATALLLGAALSPTDPVLAGDVQVGEPSDAEHGEDEVRFGLTSEAGLNDGAAFPVVLLAVALAGSHSLTRWALEDVLWRVGAGVVGGLLVGRLLGRLFFHARTSALRFAEHDADGFVALAVTFLAYGLTELVHGYGFVAVFVAACSIRAAERSHGYHATMHGFIEQIERLLTSWVLLLLGAALADGLLGALTWRGVLVGLVLLLVARPVGGLVALLGSRAGRRERTVIAVFGVRGIGSLFYLAYALGHADFPARELWATVGFTLVVSVVGHGLTASPAVARLDLLRNRRARRKRVRPTAEQIAREHV